MRHSPGLSVSPIRDAPEPAHVSVNLKVCENANLELTP